jgi:hypothetical protein
MQRRCKHAFPTKGRLCFLRGPCEMVIKKMSEAGGGGIEYLHRDPASRRRRRKGKSQETQTQERLRWQDQQNTQRTDPTSRQRGRPTRTRP